MYHAFGNLISETNLDCAGEIVLSIEKDDKTSDPSDNIR
jgi:hypothetical protein